MKRKPIRITPPEVKPSIRPGILKALSEHDPEVKFESAIEVFAANRLWHWQYDGYTAESDGKGGYSLVYTGNAVIPPERSLPPEVDLPEPVGVVHKPKPKGEFVVAEAAEIVILPDAVIILHHDGEKFARDIQTALEYLSLNRLKVSRVTYGDYAANVKPAQVEEVKPVDDKRSTILPSVSPGARAIHYHDPSEKPRIIYLRSVEFAKDRPNHPGMRVKIKRVPIYRVSYSARETRVIDVGKAPDAEQEAERKENVALIQQRLEAAAENERLRKKIAELTLKTFALKVKADLDKAKREEGW